ncbi:hypothetical protein QFZ82_007508 [Streptomyces sp. V4I23]|nr:hypothetical protein [Streptomyces sp. V4I23]
MRQGVSQKFEAGVDVAVAVLDEPVGVQDQPGALGQLQFGGLDGQARTQAEGRGDGHVGEGDDAVGCTRAGPGWPARAMLQ